jgi:hypothetical protein
MITTMSITICNIFTIENNNEIPTQEEFEPMMIYTQTQHVNPCVNVGWQTYVT